jgi:hypothetical protein
MQQPERQTMRTLAHAIGTLALFLFGTLINGTAMADYRGHAYGHGHKHHPTVRLGFSYGVPIYAPRYFPAPFYAYSAYAVPAPVYVYPPAVIRYSPAPVYVERSVAPAVSASSRAQSDWYYCAASQTYYPYARECPGGWQRVPAQPSSR